jgi:hypothetical protein
MPKNKLAEFVVELEIDDLSVRIFKPDQQQRSISIDFLPFEDTTFFKRLTDRDLKDLHRQLHVEGRSGFIKPPTEELEWTRGKYLSPGEFSKKEFKLILFDVLIITYQAKLIRKEAGFLSFSGDYELTRKITDIEFLGRPDNDSLLLGFINNGNGQRQYRPVFAQWHKNMLGRALKSILRWTAQSEEDVLISSEIDTKQK